jgi:fucose permease
VDEAKYFTSFTLAGMMVGYVIGLTCIPKFISQQSALKISAILGMILVGLAYVTSGYPSVLMVALLGLANAMMWPAIFPLGISGLGKFTEKGSAIMIMGIAGGAIVPLAFGKLKETMNFQLVFLMLMLPCYLYILYYSMKGYKAGKS